jgi:signal peptidase I
MRNQSTDQIMISLVGTSREAHAIKCDLAAEVLRASGTLRLRVMGSSMLPSVWPGDTLIIERVNSDAVSRGDIVLFGRDRRLFVHRVVAKTDMDQDCAILTRGDALPQPDRPVRGRNLLGRVSFIVRDGKLVAPSGGLRLPQRAIAALVQRSEIAARAVVSIHSMLEGSLRQNCHERAILCES